jgi:hypothetical protein
VIDRLPEQQKVAALVNLAMSVYRVKDAQENHSQATAIMQKAYSLVKERPENSYEMNLLMQVITGYNTVDVNEAIRMYEALTPKMNELTDAMAVINSFQMGSNVREGEFVMAQGPLNNYGANPGLIPSFAKIDFDRTMKLIDGYNRPEVRISLRLQLAEQAETVANRPLRGRQLVTVYPGGDTWDKMD